jgi:hypothetical protein
VREFVCCCAFGVAVIVAAVIVMADEVVKLYVGAFVHAPRPKEIEEMPFGVIGVTKRGRVRDQPAERGQH